MRFFRLVLALAVLPAALLRADSITLKSGEKLTGTIKSETDTEITIDVPVSNAITDEQVISKADIATVEKEQPDEVAYRQLMAMQPPAELSYSSQTYAQILASLHSFLSTYPSSRFAPDIQKLADLFQSEKTRVDEGQIKYLGQWLTKAEADQRRSQILAIQYYNTMQQQAAAGDLVGAMATFDYIEKNYPATRGYPKAIALGIQVLSRLKQDLVVRMQEVHDDQDRLKKTIDFTAEPEKSAIIASAKAEQDRATAAVQAAVASGSKWVPLIPRSEISISTLQGITNSEQGRLGALPLAAMNASNDKVDAARNAFAINDYKDAQGLLKDASTLWPASEAARYWTDRVNQKLATPTPGPAHTATPRPLPTVPKPSPHVVKAPPPPAAPVEEEKPFYMTLQGALPIAAGVLIVVGIAGSYIQKKTRKQTAPE